MLRMHDHPIALAIVDHAAKETPIHQSSRMNLNQTLPILLADGEVAEEEDAALVTLFLP